MIMVVPLGFGLVARVLAALVVASIVASVSAAQGRAAADGTLYVTFGQDGKTITLALADGTPVGTSNPPGTVIPAGSYAVIVDNPFRDDLSIIHMFDLSGPGVLVLSDLNAGEELQAVFPAYFQPGSTYTWQDDNRPSQLHGVFRTTPSVAAATSGSASSASKSSGSSSGGGSVSNTDVAGGSATAPAKQPVFRGTLRGTLAAAVDAAGKLTLTLKGKGVSTLKAGRYKIAVTDRTAKRGFAVQEVRKQAITLTGVSFVGKRTVTVDLRVGQWMAYSGVGKKFYFIVSA